MKRRNFVTELLRAAMVSIAIAAALLTLAGMEYVCRVAFAR